MEFKDTLRQNMSWIEYYATIQNSEYEEPVPEPARFKFLVIGIIDLIKNDEDTDEKKAYIKKIRAAKKRATVLTVTQNIIQ